MKSLLRTLRRPFVCLAVALVYSFGCLCYDKKYLTGRFFNRKHFTEGWFWILQCWFPQKVMGKNRYVPWPTPPYVCVGDAKNILFDPNDMDMFHTAGNYFQALGATVTFGRGCQIAPGTAFITANHDFYDLTRSAEGKPILLEDNCWVGMNAVVLPGVHLGPHTMVGAGSIVTKSFPEGHCVIAGNPARKIRDL